MKENKKPLGPWDRAKKKKRDTNKKENLKDIFLMFQSILKKIKNKNKKNKMKVNSSAFLK